MSHDPASLRVPPSKHFGSRAHRTSLRSVKSAESLSSAESASELQGQEKYGNILGKLHFFLLSKKFMCCHDSISFDTISYSVFVT